MNSDQRTASNKRGQFAARRFLLACYSLIADRLTPYTSQATVQAFVVRMAPEVAGRVIEVNVVDNQKAKAGDVLFRIDPQPFAITLQQAEAKLAGVGQSIGASTAAVSSAQERLVTATAKRDNTREQVARVFEPWNSRRAEGSPDVSSP